MAVATFGVAARGKGRATHWRASHVNWFTCRGGVSAIGTDMRDHVLLFCLVGLVLIAAIMLLLAPGEVTWALSLIEGPP